MTSLFLLSSAAVALLLFTTGGALSERPRPVAASAKARGADGGAHRLRGAADTGVAEVSQWGVFLGADSPLAAFPRWIRDYVRFHKAPATDATRYLVFMCPEGVCGGIGDRMKGMVSMLLWAMASRRKLLIDGYQWQGCTLAPYVPNVIDWRQPAVYASFNSTQREQPLDLGLDAIGALVPAGLRAVLGPGHVLFAHSDKLHLQPIWSTREFRAATGVGGSHSAHADVRIVTLLLTVLFQRSRALDLEVARLRRLAGLEAGAPFVALHLRTVHGVGVPFKDDIAAPAEVAPSSTGPILACVQSIARRVNLSAIYVASDDSLFKAALQRENPHQFRVGVPSAMNIAYTYDNCEQEMATYAEFELLRGSMFLMAQTYRGNFSGFPTMSAVGSPQWAAGEHCFLNWASLSERVKRRPEMCADNVRWLQEECDRFRRPCDEVTCLMLSE